MKEDMTDKEILDKALEKAVKGGYSKGLAATYLSTPIYQLGVTAIIFDHDFAKAFFGEKKVVHRPLIIQPTTASGRNGVVQIPEYIKNQRYVENQKDWKYHLQKMVLEEEPIQYLAKFLD